MARRLVRKARSRVRTRRQTRPGAVPGTVKAAPDSLKPTIEVMAYSPGKLVQEQIESVDELDRFVGHYPVTWVNVVGLGAAETIRRLGARFSLHRLALEDVVNVHQRPKVEAYEETLFVVARMMTHAKQHLESEQISLFLGSNFVLTFQERPGDCLDPVRRRLRKASGLIRKRGPDYLAYAVLDAIIDSYFPLADQYADQLDAIDERIGHAQTRQMTAEIHDVHADLLVLRRTIRPLRDALNSLVRDESPLVSEETRIFLRDCYDHVIQLLELLDMHRESCANLRDFHLSLISHRMNEVMKVLTIISTIFIPLSFIAGLYGMNFDTKSPWNMPELGWSHGYPAILSVMGLVAAAMLVFFRRRGWLGG